MVDMQDPLSPQIGVLGSVLIAPELAGEMLSRVSPEDFLSDTYRQIYYAIRSLFAEGETVDPVTVRCKLGGVEGDQWGKLLLEMMELTPTAVNIWEYAGRMKEQARLYRINTLGGQLQSCVDMEQARAHIAGLNGLLSDRPGVQRMNMEQLLLDFYERHGSGQARTYLTWGYDKLNEGLYTELGDMVVLGGYPSAGKTALAISFAWHMAERYRVGFYSLETNQYKLADRLMANLARIDMPTIKRGSISEEQWAALTEITPQLRKRTLELIQAGGMTVEDIQADALARGYQVIFVDYLQLIVCQGHNRTEQVSRISIGLHQLAQRHNITVVALSQLSRPEKKGDEDMAPTMASLRESGQIEQDADAILLLYLEEPQRPTKSRRVLKVAKNKEGERGLLYLVFDGEYQYFRKSAIETPAPAAREHRHSRPRQLTWAELNAGPPEEDPFPDPPKEVQHGV